MIDPRPRLMGLIGGYRVTQMIRGAVQLGVFDALAAGPRSPAELAAELGGDPGLVHRLLRALAGHEVVAEGADGRFANLEMGELLRSGSPGSLRAQALALPQDRWWEAWRLFPESVRDGSIPLERSLGMSDWESMAGDPAAAAAFNDFMVAMTRAFVPALLAAYDFGAARVVVDVGGGSGALLAGVLAAHPHLEGVLFDLAAGLAGAGEVLGAAGVAGRCRQVSGSFLESVPAGADTYLLRQIIHDWEDERAALILATIRRSMDPGAQLLVIDHLLPERVTDPAQSWKLDTDLHMHVLYGARERTETEMRGLLEAAGFKVLRVLPTNLQAVTVATPG